MKMDGMIGWMAIVIGALWLVWEILSLIFIRLHGCDYDVMFSPMARMICSLSD